MTFLDLYIPVLAALVSAFAISELFNFGLGYYFHKKQETARKEFEAKVASGEIDPMSMMFGGGAGAMGGMPGVMDVAPKLPTASGEGSPPIVPGQYL